MEARPQMVNVAQILLETRPALVPSLGPVVPHLAIVAVLATIAPDLTAIAVRVRRNVVYTMKVGNVYTSRLWGGVPLGLGLITL